MAAGHLGAGGFLDLLGGSEFLGSLGPAAAAPSHRQQHPSAASATRRSLEEARAAQHAAQHAAQLSGMDVAMLEELLPLSELHDPFLEADWPQELPAAAAQPDGCAAAPAQQQQQQQQRLSSAVHPAAPLLFSGIPAYAEPDIPAAAAARMNNSAGLSMGYGLGEGLAALPGSPHPSSGLPMHPQGLASMAAAAFCTQPAFAAPPAAQGVGGGLPPAIAAAQQRAAAKMQVGNGSSGGNSHISNSSSGADPAAAAAPPPLGAPPRQCAQPPSDDSSGEQLEDEHLEDASGTPSHSAAAAASADPALAGASATAAAAGASSGVPFSAGEGGKQPAKRGGRPREKKSYDALIDPSLPIEEIRRLRRTLSNRESARRSRRRRQTQVSSLETELEALKTDNERLEFELSQTSSAAHQLAAEKAALLAEVERLRVQLAQVSTCGAPPLAQHMPASAPMPVAAQQPTPVSLHMAAPAPSPVTLQPAMQQAMHRASAAHAAGLPPAIEQAQRLAHKLL
ncbi:hypothetical protein CHLNCDRAFT_139516 [Chlorella variabilis]|uniref:BZIP domain-containing protein n=1 Tax=Chlorella variabilis TaxID=554065 RepID=E1ZQB4_CHLVA|nr:hypothetical protein CHLNCDRAFT_139516 [Chlorella variabilis]EFN51995.1 hypothetical protein CHLNCDRAFT_139516 [Chlorella variabilis]|eukprot:XP_005844097.1 hypothetical protein CHLNCDRAFT_139516 [Chlorella variabilis]